MNILGSYLGPLNILTPCEKSNSVADPGGAEGAMAPPGPVKIGHEKDGRRRRPHRFHVSRPPPLPGRWIRYWPVKSFNDCL